MQTTDEHEPMLHHDRMLTAARAMPRDLLSSVVACRPVAQVHNARHVSARLKSQLSHTARRALYRLRGQQDHERLVALGLELGDRAFIAANAYLDPGFPWLITIGDGATIGPLVIVLAHDASLQEHMQRTRIARVVIGKRAFVGAGSVILPGSTIGDNAVVGAGSVVRGDVPADSVAVGNPAEVVSSVEAMLDKHRTALEQSPKWRMHEGWVLAHGITPERRREQREALPPGTSGYLESRRTLSEDEHLIARAARLAHRDE
jgi:maltose O-acetyltransferase